MIRPLIAGQIEGVAYLIKRQLPAFLEKYEKDKSLRYGLKMGRELETQEEVQSLLDMHDAWFLKLSRDGNSWVFEVDIERVLARDVELKTVI